MKLFSSKKNTALFIAALFHFCGVIGILCTPYKNWFIQHTPLNLLLMALLVVFTQKQKNIAFFSFLFIAFMVGMGTEIIGVNTGKLFGDYSYGNLMGRKWNSVPLLIGLNWFVLIYCAGVIMFQLHEWIEEKYALAGTQLSLLVQNISLIVDGALLATFFDWVMEPVAVKLGFWKWLGTGEIPDFNFLCWFMISGVLLLVFKWLPFNKHNQFAVHLYIIQLLFFLILRTFL